MADKPQPTTAPHSTTSPPAPYTPRATSIPDDSETEFTPTPLHSPGGPQYEDLPPSYDFALSDARNGAAPLDASQIEAHRVSANEGPNEPEVWEYRMRGEDAGAEDVGQHEEAPAYEGHVPVQHVASSESIPVGRVGVSAPSASTDRGAALSEDPPHSVPEGDARSGPAFSQDWSNAHSQHYGFGGRGSHRGSRGSFGSQTFGPFGAPGSGPFGAPGNGPFGAPGNGPFGRGRGAGNSRSTASRPGPSQDWAAFGQNLGKMGEEFGRRMGNWGEQFGRQAGAMGQQIGRQAGSMGQQIGRDSGAWAAAYSGPAAAQNTHTAGPSNAGRNEPLYHDEPPSYQGPAGVAGQETGVLPKDIYPAEKETRPHPEHPSEKPHGKQKTDSSSSSSSSTTSSSSSSSNSSSNSFPSAPQTAFLSRLASIERAATSASSSGTASAASIASTRAQAIQTALRDKDAAEQHLARAQARRTQKRAFRARKREMKSAYRLRKAEIGGTGKAGESAEWREVKRAFRAERRKLKRERGEAKRAWKREKREAKGKGKGKSGKAKDEA
ncbi:hypothetical protein EJ07DRAFT_182426 [Lizonia empirigonia]|nr:hypothetical protein EJ07DRAFT_182426 [Lizonia empirigonia]